MKQLNITRILFALLFSMAGITASAHDIEVNNIFYNYTSDGTELIVTFKGDFYESYPSEYYGDVAIPEEVTYMNRVRKVTGIGRNAFAGCKGLSSVSIPNSVTSIGKSAFDDCINLTSVIFGNNVTIIDDWAFSGCRRLSSITIPKTVTRIGSRAFYDTDFTFIISLIESPSSINGKSSIGYGSNAFSLNTFNNATLYVPFGTIEKYRETEGWKDFIFIEEGTGGDTPTTKKCERPSISYYNGKLIFKCATEGATCLSTISDADITSYSSNEIQLGVTYHISVYATKPGFANSDEATATLCWIDVDPKAEGLDNVAEVRANAVLIQRYGNIVSVQGAEEDMLISVYDTTGRCVGSAKASSDITNIHTTLQSGEIAIVKIGEKSVKVVI